MYTVNKMKLKGKIEELFIPSSFTMGSSNKIFKINDCDISHIKISGSSLATPMVTSIVMKKYQKLIILLTNLLTDDDDSGDSYREALNQIEKFRLEIKNKYRDFLKKKELELMAKQLMILQKEANEKYMEIRLSFLKREENKRSK